MDWKQFEPEIEQYIVTLTPEEKKVIVLAGIQTEFWKLLRAYLLNTLRSTEHRLQQLSTNSLDDLFKLGKANNSFKTVSEIFTLIEQLVNPVAAQPAGSRAVPTQVPTPKRVIKKEI